VRLRLVQGNIEQSLKWDAGRREQTFAHYIALTRHPGFERVTHVVWPETAIDYRFVSDYPAARIVGERLQRIATAIPQNGALILGAIRDERRQWFNSVHVIGSDGTVRATYDKYHLVPFGEYVPLRWLLRGLGVEQIAHGAGDYSGGPGPATLAVPAAPSASPLICYEAIFPGEVAGRPRPGWLVNVTNDAWFGLTSGPYQHFASARLRAVEEGLPLARAANTGISAVVNAYGVVVARMPIMTTGVLDAELPRATVHPTFYARLGDRSLLVLLLLGVALASAANLRHFALHNRGASI
jgi:apolipoprotein N-acyltransferase